MDLLKHESKIFYIYIMESLQIYFKDEEKYVKAWFIFTLDVTNTKYRLLF